MSKITANGIEIEYEAFGNPSDRPLLLIIGVGSQLILWDESICKDLASRGHYVIRYDNRDAGLSTKCDMAGFTDLIEIKKTIGRILRGERISVPYTIADMADDGAGLLEALGIPRAHICGMSMGGMIAQTIALRHSSRVLSLTSIYSNTGNPGLPQPKPEVMAAFFSPIPEERPAYIEHMLRLFEMITGPCFPLDEEWARRIVAANYDRCFYPKGVARQVLAILTQNNRKDILSSLRVPVLVIHGTDDPLVAVEGGKETAAVIPGAQLILIEGMGHDVPHGGAWPQIVQEITAHTLAATRHI